MRMMNGWSIQAATVPARESTLCSSPATRNTVPKKRCRSSGKILSVHHGFKCTVLFAVDPESGEINPDIVDNIPGLEALADADLMILSLRFRNLPDEQMQHFVDYVESGRPIIGMRTTTHAFQIPKDREFGRYDFRSSEWPGGFGQQILGDTWLNHHGGHKRQSTRGIIADGAEEHSIVRGCEDVWGPTDVYGVRLPLPGDSQPLVMGQVLTGMSPQDGPVEGEKNDPMMPVAWIKSYQTSDGTFGQSFTTTMGSSTDLESEGVRRLLVNAAYWCVGMEDQIPERATVDIVGEFEPTEYGFNTWVQGVKPSDHAL